MLAEVAAGVLVEAVAGTARWLKGQSAGSDAAQQALIRWFDTYQLHSSARELEFSSESALEKAEEFLRCDESQAILHELLAARLSDAPEAVIGRLREGYVAAARAISAPEGEEVSAIVAVLFDHCDMEIVTVVGGLAGEDAALLHRCACGSDMPLPFLVVLREFARSDSRTHPVIEYVESRLETYYQCSPPPGVVERLLLSGRAVVVFDGLDELIDTSHRREVTEVVELFCSRYPLATVLVTSRTVGYNEARLDDRQFMCYRLTAFDLPQAEEYVRKWFMLEEGTPRSVAEETADSFLAESEGLADLRTNPLMLSLMCILYRGTGSMPRSRPEIYEQCAALLFHKWDVRRRIHVELGISHFLEPALRHIAYWLLNEDQGNATVTEHELVQKVSGFLLGRGYENEAEAEHAARQFVDFCRGRAWVFSEVGTTARGASLYTFTHRTFLEYFAAAQLASASDTPEILARCLAPRVARQEWDIVGQLAVQIKDRATDDGSARVFTVLLSERRRRSAAGRANVLSFLARCLTCVEPPPRLVRQLTRACLDHLLSGDPTADEHTRQMGWLLASCRSGREWVRDEFTRVIGELIGSEDDGRRLSALRLAGYAASPAQSHSEVAEVWRFWGDYQEWLIGEYAEELRAAAWSDVGLMDVCLCHGLLRMRDWLPRSEAGIAPLFDYWHPGIFFGNWQPYATRCLYVLLGAEERSRPPFEDAVRDCVSIGAWVRGHPEPPWAAQPENTAEFMRFFLERVALQQPDRWAVLGPDGYLGAAVLLLTSVEAAGDPWLEHLPEALGPLSGLEAYLRARHHDGTGPPVLPELPVPEPFGDLLRAWARGEARFTGV